MKKVLVLLFVLLLSIKTSFCQGAENKTNLYWKISADNCITWDLTKEAGLPHADNIEMDGCCLFQ